MFYELFWFLLGCYVSWCAHLWIDEKLEEIFEPVMKKKDELCALLNCQLFGEKKIII